MIKQILIPIAGLLGTLSINAQTQLESFKFSGGSTTGENGATNVGTIPSTTDFDGNIGDAIEFDGTNSLQYNNLGLNASNGVSIAFWVKPSSQMSGSHVIISERGVCNHTNALEVIANTTLEKIALVLRTSSGQAMYARASYLPDVWQHFAYTISKVDGKVRSYRNGVYQGISPTGITPATIPNTFTGEFQIANGPCAGADGTKRYSGGFDELEIYNSTLSGPQISSIYDSFNASDEPIHLETFKFNGGSTTGENGSTTTGSVPSTTGFDGNLDDAIQFNGTNSLKYTNLGIKTADGVSISFWLKPNAMTGSNIVLGERGVCTNDKTMEVVLNGDISAVALAIRTESGTAMSVSAPYTPNTWEHFTFTVSKVDGRVRSYKNGVYQGTSSKNIAINSIPSSFSGEFEIANGPCVNKDGTKRYSGGFDDLVIYNSALTDNEVSVNYNNTITSANNSIENENLSIYPNPANNHINTESGQIEIYDFLGSQIINTKTEGQLDVSNLDSGIYFVILNGKKSKLVIE